MSLRGLFVSADAFLGDGGGGVQICTREYRRVIEAAGIELMLLPFAGDRRLSTRIRRQLDSSPYFRPFEPSLISRLRAALETRPDFVFLNQVALSGLARAIRPSLKPECQIVTLSHGAEITDLLHAHRLRGALPLSARFRPTPHMALGKVLSDEIQSRQEVDVTLNLSPFDNTFEALLGSHRSVWLPRIVESSPLEHRPEGHRFGFVGTLDHAPNLEGLVLALGALEKAMPAAMVRVVSGSDQTARWLAGRYRSVSYLGALDNPALLQEASTWNAFLHPIFCTARGCSTKLAQAIAWGLPIVTTPQGRRGYRWARGDLMEADSPQAFAEVCVRLLKAETRMAAAASVRDVACSSPTLSEVARELSRALGLSSLVATTDDSA